MSDKKGEYCEVCGVFVEGFEYRMCCDGRECGCMGKPVEPCICSEKCWGIGLKDTVKAGLDWFDEYFSLINKWE